MRVEAKRNPVIIPAGQPKKEYRVVMQFRGSAPISFKVEAESRNILDESLAVFITSGATIVSVEPTNHS